MKRLYEFDDPRGVIAEHVLKLRDILARLARTLAPDGFLLMGSAETVIGLSDAFAPHHEHPTLFVHKATRRQRPELMLIAN